jgi:hypothetical protein
MYGPVRRRRPLLRAAIVGGGAYMAGKSVARNKAAQATQDERISNLEQQQPVPTPAPAAEQTTMEQLNRLTEMYDQGKLTDTEFAAAKAKLLGI